MQIEFIQCLDLILILFFSDDNDENLVLHLRIISNQQTKETDEEKVEEDFSVLQRYKK
jgi:hypothetical protein